MLTCKAPSGERPSTPSVVLDHYQIIRRQGAVVPFDASEISQAMLKAFLAVHATTDWAGRVCMEWLKSLWRAIRPTGLSAPTMNQSTELSRPRHKTSHCSQVMPHRFFSSRKPDMRYAP
jgi:hypothetical protein